jgi:hypothetical protein
MEKFLINLGKKVIPILIPLIIDLFTDGAGSRKKK